MTQATDTEIGKLTDLVLSLREEMRVGFANTDKKVELGFANVDTKFANVDKKIELGFANVDTKFADLKGEISKLDNRLTLVEASVTKLDNRLWTFIGLVLTSTLGTLLAVFVRYMFWDSKM